MKVEDLKEGMVVFAAMNIYDDGGDCHPPGNIALRGDVLIVRTVYENPTSDLVASVSHPSVTDNSFGVRIDEIFKDDPLVTIEEQQTYVKYRGVTLEGRFTR